MKHDDILFIRVIQTELCRGYLISTMIFSIPVPVKCLQIFTVCCLFTILSPLVFLSVTPVSFDS